VISLMLGLFLGSLWMQAWITLPMIASSSSL